MRRCFLFIGLLLLIPVAGAAQSSTARTIDDIRQAARLHVGPFYLSPGLQLKEFGVDSNVFNQTGQQSPDFVATLTPRVDLWLPVARRVLFATQGATDLVYFHKYANQRSVDPQLFASGTVFLHRLTLTAGGHYTNTRQRLNQEIDERARRQDHSVNVGAEFRVGRKLVVGAGTSAARFEFSKDQSFRGVRLQDSLNHTTRGFGSSLRYVATPLTSFVLRADMQRDRFPFTPSKDANTVSFMPGVEFKPRALITGSARLGFKRFQPLDVSVPSYRGLAASLSLGYTLRNATTFRVRLDRDVGYSFSQVDPYFVATSFGGSIRRQLAGKFDAIVSAQRYRYAYRTITTAEPTNRPRRLDLTTNYSADLGYRIGREARLGGGVGYWRRRSNQNADVAYEGWRIGTSFSYGL